MPLRFSFGVPEYSCAVWLAGRLLSAHERTVGQLHSVSTSTRADCGRSRAIATSIPLAGMAPHRMESRFSIAGSRRDSKGSTTTSKTTLCPPSQRAPASSRFLPGNLQLRGLAVLVGHGLFARGQARFFRGGRTGLPSIDTASPVARRLSGRTCTCRSNS